MLPPLNLKAPKQITHVAPLNLKAPKLSLYKDNYTLKHLAKYFFSLKGKIVKTLLPSTLTCVCVNSVFPSLLVFFGNSIIIFLPSIIQAEEV